MTANSLTARSIRTFLAGTGASGALVAAAVVAFLTIGALFAFEGLPGGSEPAEEDSVFVGAGAPGAAADAVGGAGDAIADDPVSLPPAAVAALRAAGGAGGAGGAGLPPGAPAPGSPAAPGTPTAPGATPAAPAPTAGPTSTPQGSVGEVVEGVDQATGDNGLDDATSPITAPIDQTLDQSGVGGAVDQTIDGVNNTLGGGQ
jgi:hypothetical protein